MAGALRQEVSAQIVPAAVVLGLSVCSPLSRLGVAGRRSLRRRALYGAARVAGARRVRLRGSPSPLKATLALLRWSLGALVRGSALRPPPTPLPLPLSLSLSVWVCCAYAVCQRSAEMLCNLCKCECCVCCVCTPTVLSMLCMLSVYAVRSACVQAVRPSVCVRERGTMLWLYGDRLQRCCRC